MIRTAQPSSNEELSPVPCGYEGPNSEETIIYEQAILSSTRKITQDIKIAFFEYFACHLPKETASGRGRGRVRAGSITVDLRKTQTSRCCRPTDQLGLAHASYSTNRAVDADTSVCFLHPLPSPPLSSSTFPPSSPTPPICVGEIEWGFRQ